MALFARSTKLGPGAYGARHARAKPSVRQLLLAASGYKAQNAFSHTRCVCGTELWGCIQHFPLPDHLAGLGSGKEGMEGEEEGRERGRRGKGKEREGE